MEKLIRREKRRSVESIRSRHALWYLLPGTLVMIVFVILPMLASVGMSFFNIKSLYGTWEFVLLSNYGTVLTDPRVYSALGRTVLFGAVGLVLGMGFGLLWSFFVAKHRFLNFYRYVFYLPAIVSAVTMARLWNYVFTPNEFGLFNQIIMKLGVVGSPVNWLGEDDKLLLLVCMLNLYGAGGGMTLVLFTTAINNVDESVLESARLDGAGGFLIAVRIQIPLIMPVISSYLMLTVIGAFKNFESVYALAPGKEGVETIAVFLYKNVLNSSEGFGYASAIGVVLTFIVMAVMAVWLKLSRRRSEI